MAKIACYNWTDKLREVGWVRRLSLVSGALAALFLAPAVAQKGGKEKPAAGKRAKFRLVTFVTEPTAKMEVFFKGGTRARIEGGFTASTEEGVLKAERCEYNEKEGKIVAEGNVLFYDERNRGTAKRVEVDLEERKAVLEGGVRLVIVPKQGKAAGKGKGAKEKAGPAIVTCEKIVYWYREKRAITEGKVAVEQERERNGKKVTIRITADKAEYRTEERNGKREEVIVLEGSVRFGDSEGQFLACQKLTYSLTEERMEAEGQVEARFKVEEKSEGKEAKPAEGGETGGKGGG